MQTTYLPQLPLRLQLAGALGESGLARHPAGVVYREQLHNLDFSFLQVEAEEEKERRLARLRETLDPEEGAAVPQATE
jgi:hypothetical protein